MKVLYIYNPESEVERNLMARAEQEMSTYITSISIFDAPEILKSFVRATPCAIFVGDHLQGDELLDESTPDGGQLRVTAELYKFLQEEENVLFDAATKRIDSIVNAEVTSKIAEKEQVLTDALSLLQEGGLI